MFGKRFSRALAVTATASLVLAAAAFASDVDVAVVDVTVPTNSVTLAPGASGNININMSVTGNQVGTATFEVYRDWTLTGGTFTGSNPQEFSVAPRSSSIPATTFSTTGTVTVASGHAAGGPHNLAVGAFDITNSNATGAKLEAGNASNYAVTVTAPPPPSDTTAPVISYVLNPALPDGSNGWYTSNVTLTWTVTENESASSLVKTGCVDQNITADQAATTYSCSASSDGGTASQVNVTIKRDGTAPTVAYTSAQAAVTGGGPNAAGWYKSDVTATFTATDNLSGFGSTPSLTTTGTNTTSGEGSNVTVGSPAFTDNAGNSAAAGAATSDAFKIDLSDPTNVAFVGGPAAGSSYYFGSVPAAPTCTADDAISGLASCVVSNYGSAVGSHTMTATATDNAGRTATATRSYTVLAWTLNGFYSPVDMNNALNIVKAGSTVPLKFEIFAGSTEFTTIDMIASFKVGKVPCGALDTTLTDDIEIYSTGQTVLRYDSTGGQFIQNWQVPKSSASAPSGTCYTATMTTLDGSSITAYFKTK